MPDADPPSPLPTPVPVETEAPSGTVAEPADRTTAESATLPTLPPSREAGENTLEPPTLDVPPCDADEPPADGVPPVPEAQVAAVMEALLFASADPIKVDRLKKLMGLASVVPIRNAAKQLREEYQRSGRSFELLERDGGYVLQTRVEFEPYLRRMVRARRELAISRPALETLSVIAYRNAKHEPPTRAEIDMVRGADSTHHLRTLLDRGWVRIVGRRNSPGFPAEYGVSPQFMRQFGLASLRELPQEEDFEALQQRLNAAPTLTPASATPAATTGDTPAASSDTPPAPADAPLISVNPPVSEPREDNHADVRLESPVASTVQSTPTLTVKPPPSTATTPAELNAAPSSRRRRLREKKPATTAAPTPLFEGSGEGLDGPAATPSPSPTMKGNE